jgi:indole-3-glycerol phosphate synthase
VGKVTRGVKGRQKGKVQQEVKGNRVTGFIDQIIKDKEIELAKKKAQHRARELERNMSKHPVRDFRQAIHGGGKVIAEIKAKSPRVAAYRQNGPPEKLASVYQAAGASAISIVTDEANFGTSYADIARVRNEAVLPILSKNFIIDEYQVIEAWAAGADAVLLIARILPRDALGLLLDRVNALGMAALVECHDEEDLEKAALCEASIIGVNNRDLRTLEISLETTRRLIPSVPDQALVVSESGIGSRGEIRELTSLGVDAFLVGGALLNSTDPGRTLRALIGMEGPRTDQ